MPTFYEGESIETLTVTLNSNDFQNGFLLAEQNISPLHHRGVKAGLCLTLAALIGSVTPLYIYHFASFWIPICGIICALAAAVFFFVKQPQIIQKWAAQVFESNQLLGLKSEIVLYRDSVTIQNGYEKGLEYWTDFEKCLENSDYFVMTDGSNRQLFIIKKQELSQEQLALVSTHLMNTFARRYHKIRH